MREVFHTELAMVQERLVDMSERVVTAITAATNSFASSDLAQAEAVIAGDGIIDDMAAELDESSIELLALQQPVAGDLRIVVSALRIGASLERMGDLAEHIAALAQYRFPERVVPASLRETFAELARLDVAVATKLTELLRTQRMDIVDEINDLDERIDELHAGVFRTVLSESWTGGTADTVDATLASRYHERFADHAVSIAAKVQYLATGDLARG